MTTHAERARALDDMVADTERLGLYDESPDDVREALKAARAGRADMSDDIAVGTTDAANGIVEDGYGSRWAKCGPDCTMEVVRPGKVQCLSLIDAITGNNPRPATCYDNADLGEPT